MGRVFTIDFPFLNTICHGLVTENKDENNEPAYKITLISDDLRQIIPGGRLYLKDIGRNKDNEKLLSPLANQLRTTIKHVLYNRIIKEKAIN